MKTTLGLFLLLASINNLFAQEINSKMSNALPNEYIYSNQILFNKGKIYYFDNDQAYKERAVVLNTENDQAIDFEQKKLTIDDYVISLAKNKKHIHGDHLYELTYCSNKKRLVNFGYAILKRNLNTISEVEKVLWVENFDVSPSMASMINVAFYPGKDCFYIIRDAYVGKNGEQNFIAKYNYNLEEIWKKDFSFINETGISIDYVNVNENDDLLVAIKIKGAAKGGWFKSIVVQSGLFFYIIKNNGEELKFSPKIDQNIMYDKYDLQFYPEKEEVVGIFSTHKVYEKDYSSYGNGFVYMKWDNEGSLLTSTSHYFELEELKNPALDQYLAAKKQTYKKFLDKKSNMTTLYGGFHSYFSANQEVVAKKGRLIYKVDSEGELEWVNFSDGERSVGHFLSKDDVIHICYSDYKENFSTGKFQPASKAKTEILSVQTLDAKTGELIETRPVNMVFPSGYLLHGGVWGNEENLSFFAEYRRTKNNSRKIVSFNL